MAARRKGRDVHAVFLLDKPAGISSNQALQKVRRLLDARKAGHTGTLDPFATGLLPICLGEASKTAGLIMDGRKSYAATLQLGTATATGDTEGEVIETLPVPDLGVDEISAALHKFCGRQEQVPPMYSAIKQDGKPLYELARQGLEVERKPREIEIFRIEARNWAPPLLEFSVVCSKGTYIRTLAEDLARALGCCGHLVALRRIAAEPFGESPEMHTLEELAAAVEQDRVGVLLLPADAGLPEWPVVELEGDQASRFLHGNSQDFPGQSSRVRVHGHLDGSRQILGLGEIGESGQLQPSRVFVPGVAAQPEWTK